MKKLLILSIFIAVLSRGIHGEIGSEFQELHLETPYLVSPTSMSELPADIQFLLITGYELYIEPNTFLPFKNLTKLAFRSGKLDIVPDTFNGLHKLQHLDLDSSSITSLHPKTFYPLTTPDSTHLKVLKLNRNKIQEIRNGTFQNFANMSYLTLGGNHINNIEPGAFAGSQIERLNIINNHLEVLHKDAFQGLQVTSTLEIARNYLRNIPEELFSTLGNVMTLSLNHNWIQFIEGRPFKSLSNLRTLRLGSNGLEYLGSGVFAGLHKLEELDLSVNSLQEISSDLFQDLTNLKVLNLHSNSIKSIDAGTFKNLHNMLHLTLASNIIRYIAPGAFAGLELETLNLSGNQLESLHNNTFEGAHVTLSLDLSKNQVQEIPNGLFHSLGNASVLNFRKNPVKVITMGSYKIFLHEE